MFVFKTMFIMVDVYTCIWTFNVLITLMFITNITQIEYVQMAQQICMSVYAIGHCVHATLLAVCAMTVVYIYIDIAK